MAIKYPTLGEFSLLNKWYDKYTYSMLKPMHLDNLIEYVKNFNGPDEYNLRFLEDISCWKFTNLNIVKAILTELIEHNNISNISDSMNCKSNWIYQPNYNECPFDYLKPNLKKFIDSASDYNLHPLFDLIIKIHSSGYKKAVIQIIENYKNYWISDVISIEAETCNDILECIRFNMTLQDNITAAGSVIMSDFDPFNFEKLGKEYFYKTLKNMYVAINEIEEAKEAIMNIYTNTDKYYEIIKKIFLHPSVQENHLSKQSMLIGINAFNFIYEMGWERFVKVELASKGIGLEFMSFDDALSIRNSYEMIKCIKRCELPSNVGEYSEALKFSKNFGSNELFDLLSNSEIVNRYTEL